MQNKKPGKSNKGRSHNSDRSARSERTGSQRTGNGGNRDRNSQGRRSDHPGSRSKDTERGGRPGAERTGRGPKREDERGGRPGAERSGRGPIRADERGGRSGGERTGRGPKREDERGGRSGGERSGRGPGRADERSGRPGGERSGRGPGRADERSGRGPGREDERGGRPGAERSGSSYGSDNERVRPVKSGRNQSRGRKQKEAKSEEMRLNKYIAHAGVCSRREADKLIEAGLVSVNGKVVSEVGTKVNPDDDVRYNGERLGNERKVYLVLNKPKDYVTTVEDPHAKKTVMELVHKACKERIYPVGRLDKNTTGILLFTNDGELTRKLTHPSYNKKKVYHVFLNKNLAHSDLRKIAEGLELDDGPVQVDAIAYSNMESKKEIGLEIHSGRNRIVRRIFEHLDYKVTKLDRVYFAGLTKKDLPRGRWRFLTDKEIKMLKMNAYE